MVSQAKDPWTISKMTEFQPVNGTAHLVRVVVLTVAALHGAGWLGGLATAAAAEPMAKAVRNAGPATRAANSATRAKVITTHRGAIGRLLRKWYREGTAAGNVGDYYDNRDRGHSQLNMKLFPQLSQVEYTDQARKRRLDWGLQLRITSDQVTIGNSSTASGATSVGSHTRLCMLSPQAMQALYNQYRRSHLYVYPEHRDHDVGHNGLGGYGDLMPANTPYVITSQGSSGSDRPFVEAVAFTLAAFRPEVKSKLISTGLLMPTVQMILRASSKNVKAADDYLSGQAHPTAFDSKDLDTLKMVKMARAIRPGNIPPMVQLSVLEEDTAERGRDYFEPDRTEKLFDTPAAISRIWRSSSRVRRMVVSASASADVNNLPLTYHWRLLRGDPGLVRIEPLNDNASKVELLVEYHERMPIQPGSKMQSNRVDIGLFVHNGEYYSAPGFVSFYSLDSEARTYDAQGRILEIDYASGETTIGLPGGGGLRLDDAYGIRDWRALLTLAVAGGDGFASEILRRQLDNGEIEVLRRVQERLRPALARTHELKQDLRHAKAARAEIAAAVKANGKDLATTKETAVRSVASGQVDRIERRLAKIEKRISAVLAASQPALAGRASAGQRIVGILNEVKGDPRFYIDSAAQIEGAIGDDEQRKLFQDARDVAVADGVLAVDCKGRYRLSPMVAGDEPPSHRLTKWQRGSIERFNAAILQHVLYPGLVVPRFTKNYVSPYLSTPKNWRDVYRYAADGRLIGWTRHSPAGQEEFTYDGAIVIGTDTLGRALEARTVRYVVEKDASRRPIEVKQLPGDSVFNYQYDSQTDRVGHSCQAK